MHQLEQVQHGFGLIFGRADLDQRADGEVRQVYLEDGGEGFWVVPGQDEGVGTFWRLAYLILKTFDSNHITFTYCSGSCTCLNARSCPKKNSKRPSFVPAAITLVPATSLIFTKYSSSFPF